MPARKACIRICTAGNDGFELFRVKETLAIAAPIDKLQILERVAAAA